MSQRALAVLSEGVSDFPATSAASFYTSVYTFDSNGAQLYAGVVGRGGSNRRVRSSTLVIASSDLRSPSTVLLSKDAQSGLFRSYPMSVVRLGIQAEQAVCAHYLHSLPAQADLVAHVVRLVFGRAEGLFNDGVSAILGRGGLVISGPVLNATNLRSDEIVALISAAERLLDNCAELWVVVREAIEYRGVIDGA